MNKQNTRTSKPGRLEYLCICALITCAMVFSGCSQPQQKATIGPISVPDVNMAETMEIAEDVLTKMHFPIDKVDIPSGYLITRPLPGAQFFEFWRSDNVGSKNALQANLHTIRRTVELNVSPKNDQLEIDCDVRVQRLCLPEREVVSSGQFSGMHTSSSSKIQKFRFDAIQAKGIAWIDLDSDTKLEAEILRRIEKQTERRAKDKSQTAEKQS